MLNTCPMESRSRRWAAIGKVARSNPVARFVNFDHFIKLGK